MSGKLQKGPRAILCDMCTGDDKNPAQKTCMKCEISMCIQHLQAHLITPVLLQTHPLTEPMASGNAGLGGSTKCSQHGKLLEYYCLDDMTCVCVSCAIEDQHRQHNMKTFSAAHKELLEKLNTEQEALQVKTDDKNLSLGKWEASERMKLGHSAVRLIEAVTSLRDIALTSVQSSVSARMVSIKTSKSSMRAAQEEKDTFRFLQMYSQVHQDVEKAKAVDLRKGLEPGSDRDKLVQEIRQNGEKMVEQANQFWGSLLTLVDPESHQELTASGSDLIFDPQSLGPSILLSKDKRKVFYGGQQGQCSATLLIRSTKTVPHIQRWVISLSPDCDWTIGLCDERCARSTNLMDGLVYGLCCKDNQLSSLTSSLTSSPSSPLSSPLSSPGSISLKTGYHVAGSGLFGMQVIPEKEHRVSSALITHVGKEGNKAAPRPEMVEVFWNVVSSSLSFFSRTRQHQREEIITIKMSLNNQDLAPFVQLGTNNVPNMSQQGLEFFFGGSHFENRGQFGSIFGIPSQQSHYSHGAMIGDAYIAEVVCELQ